MNLYIVRHGETKSNIEKRYCGLYESELTEVGQAQGLALNKRLSNIGFDKIYTSCSKRAEITADIITEGAYSYKDPRLNELNFGIFDNKTYDEIQKHYPLQCTAWQKDWKDYVIPQGESTLQAFQRVKRFMKDMEKSSEENILIVTHGGIIRLMYCYILNENLDLYWKFHSSNGGLSVLTYEYENWSIKTIEN